MKDKTPQIEKMAFSYLKEVLVQDSFQKSVLKIRQKFTNGVVEMTTKKSGKKSLEYLPPDVLQEFSDPRFDIKGLEESIYKNILIPYSLSGAFYIPIRNYIIDAHDPEFNESDWGEEGIVNGVDFGLVKTVETNKEIFDKKFKKELEKISYPIAIKVSPYVTQRALLDYIKKRYRLDIQPKLKHYRKEKSVLGKQRTKKDEVVKRNSFIYYCYSQLDWKPAAILKFLMHAQKKFFKFDISSNNLDLGAINKIISLERKRRKQM